MILWDRLVEQEKMVQSKKKFTLVCICAVILAVVGWDVFESSKVRKSYAEFYAKARGSNLQDAYAVMSPTYRQHHSLEDFRHWIFGSDLYDASRITWIGFGVSHRNVHFGRGDRFLWFHLGGLIVSMERDGDKWAMTGESEQLYD